MPVEISPTLLRLSAGIPFAGLGGLLGYLVAPKQHRGEGVARGAGIGYLTGTGLGLGAQLGHTLGESSGATNTIPHMLAGGLAGSVAGTGVGRMMQGEPEWERKRKFREELISLLKSEHEKLKAESAQTKFAYENTNEPRLTRFARENPESAIVPATTLAGAVFAKPTKKKPLQDTIRGALTGLLTGTGGLVGANIGRGVATDPTAGIIAGGGIGGLLSYLAAKGLLSDKESAHPALSPLIEAKKKSDEGNYSRKYQILRRLMEENPDDFYVDSVRGNIAGITHKALNFKIHLPVRVLPPGLMATRTMSPATTKETV